jgi:hypothetical protein
VLRRENTSELGKKPDAMPGFKLISRVGIVVTVEDKWLIFCEIARQ